MFENFKPINDYVRVEPIEKEPTTSGGIIIPGEAKDVSQVGIVIHAGKSTQIFSGDKVFFKKYAGVKVDEKILAIKEEDILGVL